MPAMNAPEPLQRAPADEDLAVLQRDVQRLGAAAQVERAGARAGRRDRDDAPGVHADVLVVAAAAVDRVVARPPSSVSAPVPPCSESLSAPPRSVLAPALPPLEP